MGTHDSTLSTIPAGTRLEHLYADVGLPQGALLGLLKAAFGGDDAPPWPANQRGLLWSAGQLRGHVSVQRRWFIVNQRYFEGWFVGGVCTHPDVQGSGIATQLLQRAHADLRRQELSFAVLNCNRTLVGFYERVGYVQIAARALYIRADQIMLDEDPALAISLKTGFDVAVLACAAFPFGFDF